MKKRIVSLFMALVMTLSLLPSAWAAELTVPQEDTASSCLLYTSDAADE